MAILSRPQCVRIVVPIMAAVVTCLISQCHAWMWTSPRMCGCKPISRAGVLRLSTPVCHPEYPSVPCAYIPPWTPINVRPYCSSMAIKRFSYAHTYWDWIFISILEAIIPYHSIPITCELFQIQIMKHVTETKTTCFIIIWAVSI